MPSLTSRRNLLLGNLPSSQTEERVALAGSKDIGTILEEAIENPQPLSRLDAIAKIGKTSAEIALPESQRPSELVGSPASLRRQRRRFEIDDLTLLRDEDLQQGSYFRESGRLVVVSRDHDHYFVEQVPFPNAQTRPYVKLFLLRLADQYHRSFNSRLKVTSLTRSVEYQNRLRLDNPNATRPEFSPHCRGAGLDVSHRDMSTAQKNWMRDALVQIEGRGVIEATEETGQRTFHIMVFKNYVDDVRRRIPGSRADFERYFTRMTGGRIY